MLFAILALVVSLNGFSSELSLNPDAIPEHCVAFKGIWTRECAFPAGRECKKWGPHFCKNRLEFQQRPLAKGLLISDEDQSNWCQLRGGQLVSQGRGRACVGAKSSQGLKRYPIEKMDEVVMDVQKECIEAKDWAKEKCSVVDSGKINLNTDYTNAIELPIMPSIFGIYSHITNTIPHEKGDIKHDQTLSLLENAMIGLNSCQKACLAKCAAGAVLDYAHGKDGGHSNRYKVASISGLYEGRLGVCTEYARVAADLGDELNIGIDIITDIRSKHAYNLFNIDGEWYYGEPQQQNCEFYHTDRTLEKYVSYNSKNGKIYDGERGEIIKLPTSSRTKISNKDASVIGQ